MNLRILRRAEAFAQALFSCSFMGALNVNLLSRTTPRILSVSFVWTLESLTWNSHWYDDGPMAIACVLAALICQKIILNHLDSTLRSESITNCKIRLNKAARRETGRSLQEKRRCSPNRPFSPLQRRKIYCPGGDFAQKAKSRGGTLVARAYIKESTYS